MKKEIVKEETLKNMNSIGFDEQITNDLFDLLNDISKTDKKEDVLENNENNENNENDNEKDNKQD